MTREASGVLRGWQSVWRSARGIQRVACVEIDLAARPATAPPRLEYVPFAAPDRGRQLVAIAEFMGQFGRQAPARRSVLVVGRGPHAETFGARYPGLPLPESAGAQVIAADAGELAVLNDALRHDLLGVRGKRPLPRTGAGAAVGRVVERVWDEQRVLFLPAGKHDFRREEGPPERIDLIVGASVAGGLPADGLAALAPAAAFNGGYFLWVDDELRDPYGFCLDHVGLVVLDGVVVSPPLFRRSAIVATHAFHGRADDDARHSLRVPRLAMREVSLADVAMRLPSGLVVHGAHVEGRRLPPELRRGAVGASVNPPRPGRDETVLYTRFAGASKPGARTARSTPVAPDRLEYVVAGREICAIGRGGGTYIPMNGFVLSLPRAPGEELGEAVAAGDHLVTYALDLGDELIGPRWAVQVGPRLVRDGQPLDVLDRLRQGQEEFASRDEAADEEGVPPIYVTPERQVDAPIARVGLGLRPDARCVVALMEGCEPRTSFPEWDSAGVTTGELSNYLIGLGCTDVVQLDGGGSAVLFFDGRPIAKGADRNDVPFVAAARALPGAWCVWER